MQEQSTKTKYGHFYSKLPSGSGFFIGNYSLIEHNPVAVYCSRKIPLSVFEQSNEVVSALIERDVVLAGGWQSSMEKRLLKNIRKFENAKIIYFLAKGIQHRPRPFKLLEPLLEQDRLLVLSLHESEERITRKLVEKRDHWMRKMLQRFFFFYIDPNGKLKKLYEELSVEHAASLSREKKVFLLNHPENRPFMNDSVILIDKYNLEEVINA